MRILHWSPNHDPEPTGIPPLITNAAESLAAQRHSMQVVTAAPNHPQHRIHPQHQGVLARVPPQRPEP